MKIIVGLGNPGTKYEKTRHNAGFMVVEALAKKLLISNYKFINNNKFKSEICEFRKDILLVKPQTFMNNSGESVQLLNSYFKILNSDLWVIHDDMDLELGRVKVQFGGGSGGHHGIESIAQHINTPDFVRIRFGVGRARPEGDVNNYEDIGFLLSRFTDDETKTVNAEIKKCVEIISYMLENDLTKAMNEYNVVK